MDDLVRVGLVDTEPEPIWRSLGSASRGSRPCGVRRTWEQAGRSESARAAEGSWARWRSSFTRTMPSGRTSSWV